MGLDIVELVMAVEVKFQISLPDEELSTMCTVGDLHALVMARLQTGEGKRCLTSAAFYRTRRGIVDVLGINRREILPTTPLASVLPVNGRRKTWRRIQAAMSLKLPDLQRPNWIRFGFVIMGVAVTVAAGIHYGASQHGFVLFFLGMIAGELTMRSLPQLAVAFPNQSVTVGDLSRQVLTENYARLEKQTGGWDKVSVWDALCEVIVTQTGVAVDELKPEARIVQDLGID